MDVGMLIEIWQKCVLRGVCVGGWNEYLALKVWSSVQASVNCMRCLVPIQIGQTIDEALPVTWAVALADMMQSMTSVVMTPTHTP